MSDEGQKAIDAAAYMAAKTAADFFGDRLPENFDTTLSIQIAKASVKAYLAALHEAGWSFAPHEEINPNAELWPPPGLED